jgi:DNA-binding Xre family transcriptional regulator
MKATPALRKWFEERMDERGWSPAMLAQSTGVSHATWSRFIHNRQRDLNPATVKALCVAFGVTEFDLFHITHRIESDPAVQSLADWLRANPDARQTVFRAATRQGWQSPSNQPGKSLKINTR